MSKSLVIVESPTKAKTIEKFLGKNFEVLASYGHVRDLPNNASEVPEALKKEKWAKLGVNPDKNFETLYVVPEAKKKRVKELKDALKDADELLLATDEDREGESISWHLLELLKPKVPVKRLVFHEITKEAISKALDNTRTVDESLVRAQETRRVIDRLFGYSVSPLLWKKMKPQLSAGRVQSVAVRLLVQRERERIAFHSAEYWDLKAQFVKDGESFDAELTELGGKRIALGKDFDSKTGALLSSSDVVLLKEQEAQALATRLRSAKGIVSTVEQKPFTQKPSPPFTTSTLQQEGVRKLGYGAKRTMAIAQTLYENGFITYMRTDSTNLSDEAIEGARSLAAREFGKEFIPQSPRIYKTKVKNAQEAHEAIRPAGTDFTDPSIVKTKLGDEAFKLYDLIWKRTVACQMKDAEGQRLSVVINIDDAKFRASGKTIDFAGFLRAYVEGSDDPEGDLEAQERRLPKMAVGDLLDTRKLEALKHETQPPARYTEGSLIKELERLGIGRPSTWATIVDVVLSRDYAFKRGTALVPTFLATAVCGLMERYFTRLVDYEFTARLEDDLDSISRGESDHLGYLKGFYFGNEHAGLKALVESGEKEIDPRIVCGLPIGELPDGKKVEIRIGRWGPFLSDGERRAGLPENLPPEEVTIARAVELLEASTKAAQPLMMHPTTGLPVYLKNGRFGPYVQMGEMVKDSEEKPKMVSLLPGTTLESVTPEMALKLLELPRTVGVHPESGVEITAQLGRYGAYVKCGAESRSLPAEISVLDVNLEQSLELLKQPPRRGRQSAPKLPLKVVGKHPESGAEIVVKSGQYGPYVTDGTVNASLPRGQEVGSLTLEISLDLLKARAEKIASGEVRPKRGGKARGSRGASAGKKAEAGGKAKKTKAKKTAE